MLALACWFCCFSFTSEATAAEQRIKSTTACFGGFFFKFFYMCTSAPALTEEEKSAVSFSFPSLHLRLPISSSHLSPSLLLRSDSANGGRHLRVPPSVQTSPSAPSTQHPPPSISSSISLSSLISFTEGRRPSPKRTGRDEEEKNQTYVVGGAEGIVCSWATVSWHVNSAAASRLWNISGGVFFRPQMQNKSIVSQEIGRWALTGKSTDSPQLQI